MSIIGFPYNRIKKTNYVNQENCEVIQLFSSPKFSINHMTSLAPSNFYYIIGSVSKKNLIDSMKRIHPQVTNVLYLSDVMNGKQVTPSDLVIAPDVEAMTLDEQRVLMNIIASSVVVATSRCELNRYEKALLRDDLKQVLNENLFFAESKHLPLDEQMDKASGGCIFL